MTLNQFAYFVAIENDKSFSKAARQMHVTQPALTTQIKLLEEELGVQLLDRGRKPVVLTDAGTILLGQAKKVLQEINRTKNLINNFSNRLDGNLRLGIIPTLGPYLAPLFLDKFLSKYHEVSLSIKEAITHDIISLLRSGKLDAGIISTPISHSDIISTPMFYERFYLYSSVPLHRSDQVPIKKSALKSMDLWMLSEGNCFRDQAEDVCLLDHNKKKSMNLSFESSSIASLMRIVEMKKGATLIPELATLNLNTEQEEYLYDFESPVPAREISLVVSRNYVQKNLVAKLIEEIVQNIPASLLHLEGKYKVETILS